MSQPNDSFRKGRKRDEVRKHFTATGKISVCNYCSKRFSSAVTLALKGHLAGDGFGRMQKTTSCPSVPLDVKEYYIYHMMTRKRYTKKRNRDKMSSPTHLPAGNVSVKFTSKEVDDDEGDMDIESDFMSEMLSTSSGDDINNNNNDDTHSSDTSVTSSPVRNINDYIDNEDYDEYNRHISLRNHLHFDARAVDLANTFFNATMMQMLDGANYNVMYEDDAERLILESVFS
jgi:hypothetical protein